MARRKVEVAEILLKSSAGRDPRWWFVFPQYPNLTDGEFYLSAEEALAAAQGLEVDFECPVSR